MTSNVTNTTITTKKEKDLIDFIQNNRKKLYTHHPNSKIMEYMFVHEQSNEVTNVVQFPRCSLDEDSNRNFPKILITSYTKKNITKYVEKKELTDDIEKLVKQILLKERTGLLTAKNLEIFILTVEKVCRKQITEKIRHAGHLTDSKLQREPLTDKRKRVDTLSIETKEKIESSGFQLKVVSGIRLDPREDKMVNAIYKLLHDKSENRKTTSELFYNGNEKGEIVAYGGNDQKAKSTLLRVKKHELYKEYCGKDNYSGKDIIYANAVLFRLETKRFLIQYDRQRQIKKGNKTETVTDRIEDYQSIIRIISYIEGMTEKETRSLDNHDNKTTVIRKQKEYTMLALNPIFTDQIQTKYVEYPSDINKRTNIASGGASRVTESIICLRDYLLREISCKRRKCELNEETLINQLRLDSYAKAGRKKLVKQRISGAIKANENLRIISRTEVRTGAKGQKKYLFTLNPNFE